MSKTVTAVRMRETEYSSRKRYPWSVKYEHTRYINGKREKVLFDLIYVGNEREVYNALARDFPFVPIHQLTIGE